MDSETTVVTWSALQSPSGRGFAERLFVRVSPSSHVPAPRPLFPSACLLLAFGRGDTAPLARRPVLFVADLQQDVTVTVTSVT